MITAISTIKTHITITRLATRGALIALFAGLFILAACGGGGGGGGNNVVDPGGGTACTNPFAEGCGDEAARAKAINTCRGLIERNEDCVDTIPDAVLACLTDPYKDSCDVEAYNTAIRTKDAKVLIEALRTGRTDDCRGRSLAGARLCDGAIDNTCLPISRATNASRNQLVLDNLCNNAPNYLTARQNFVIGCTDRDLHNDVGCTDPIVTCTTEPFGDGCNVDVFDSYRAVQCHNPPSGTANPLCRSESIIANYCADNIFIETAGCVSNPDFDGARIIECITGNNGVQTRCQNTGIFKTAGITECFVDPYGTDCDDIEGYNLINAQNSRKTYCTGIGMRADGNTFCTKAISNVCTGDSADIFDPLCFDAIYQTERETACRVTDLNDVRCTETVTQLCANNPFTQTTGGTTGDLCTDADDARAALVTRCAIETVDKTGCAGVSVGAVTLQNCIDDPYLTGCEDAAFDDIKVARYNNCVGQDSADFICTGVEATICQSDIGKINDLANPFLSLCRASTANYGIAQRDFCAARTGDNRPECDMDFIMTCDDDPFDRDCIDTDAYELDRAVIITACLADIDAGTAVADSANCRNSVGSGVTVGDCAADPFATANGCNTNAGFAGTRTARTALCTATATPFDRVCNSFAGIDAVRVTHCATAETSFTADCNETDYPGTLALRVSFCTRPANLFTPLCTGAEAQLSLDNTRTALVLACSENAASAGCDQFANGVFGATIADCTSDLFNTNNGCNDNTSFAVLRRTRTALCETAGEQFNALCNDFPGIGGDRGAYCTAGAGSFDTNCELEHAAGAATARVAFARLCLSAAIAATPRDDCANTSVTGVKGGVSVADCIDNPYRLECYGTETARNPDFIEEVRARDVACRDGEDIYNSLCLNSAGEEIVEGVIAAREAGCTTPAQAAFNDACTEEAYPGTESAQKGYCSTDATSGEAVGRCSPYEVSICGDDINANPFAAICGDNNGDKQATFCGLPNNSAVGCSNVATVVCPSDPFNRNAGFAGMTDCLMDTAYLNDRAAGCAAGTPESEGNCNTSEIEALVCVATGLTANPFATFCESATDVDLAALKTTRTNFANACASAGAVGPCAIQAVEDVLCSGSGDFIRPFSDICDGVSSAISARISFCGAGDNVIEESTRCNAVIAFACREDPFSPSCTNTESAASYIAELRDLRAAHCESLTDADDLCSADAVTSVCAGYTGVSGAVPANPLANLCAENSLYDDPRRDACLALNTKNEVCDGVAGVEDACSPNPFDDSNPGCALISTAKELQIDWCEIGTNTWLPICNELAGETDGVNDVATARTNACLAGTSGTTSQCKALASVMMACEATPFADGCIIFTGTVLDGYELAYCSVTATAWDVGCDDLVGTNAVDLARTQACTLEAEVPNNAESKCNDDVATIAVCEPTPLAPNFLGCKFLDRFEEFATNYCTGSTTWEEVCNMRAGLNGGDNDIFRARRTACLASVDADAFPNPTCATITIDYCGDTDNSANAFDDGCSLAVFPLDGTTLEKQRQKACAEGGMNAAGDVDDLCLDQTLARAYCTATDPYAGTGCEELASELTMIRETYCTNNVGATGCGETSVVCMANPFDGRCVDEAQSETYATARKTRADECRDNTKSGADCLGRVTACNNRPFGATAAHFPVSGTATTCSTDPAFADARAALITKCIEIDAVNDEPDCENAVTDQKTVSGVSCLENPYLADCTSLTQLGNAGNVMEARNNFCRTTTGMNSFNSSCDGENADIKQARVDSCLHSDSANVADCPALITGFCTATNGLTAFDDRCTESEGNHRTGNAFVRTTLCANGATDNKCTETGDSFATWRDDSAGVNILKAGAGATNATANFISGVINAGGTLHLGDNPNGGNSIIAETYTIRLNDLYGGVALRGDAEDGFVIGRADVSDASTNRFFAGILHTTDLGAPITDSSGRALWKGVILAFRYDGTSAYIHNADFELSIDFDAGTLEFDGFQGAVTLLGGTSLSVTIVEGTSFNKTTGLITGQVLFADNTVDSTKTSTGTLRGVIGGDGVVAVFATPTAGTFGHFVGGFVASSRDSIPVCQNTNTNPFGEGCDRDEDADVLLAQFNACSTGSFENGIPVDNPADCNDVKLSGVICSDDIAPGSRANPFARICSDDAITIFHSGGTGFGGLTDLDGDNTVDLDDVRQRIRNHCADGLNPMATVCIARQARINFLDSRCVATNLPTLFGSLCSSYREFVDVQTLVCRNRADKTMTTHDGNTDGFACNTKYIEASICLDVGETANPFDEGICGKDGKYAGARKLFAFRCAGDLANDPSVTRVLNGANCMTSGLDQACLSTPFSNCVGDEDYDTVREDRRVRCRDHATVKYKDIPGNIFDYNCGGAIIDVCGTGSNPKDADLFSDKLCTNSDIFDDRRAEIVKACDDANDPTNANCILVVATGIDVNSCFTDPYKEECAHAAFGGARATGLTTCDIATFVSTSAVATGEVNCLKVQTSVCGGGVYAGDPFAAFCEKKDVTDVDNPLTIDPVDLADGRNKYCQDSTNRANQGCAEFLARPTTAALLAAQTNELEDSPNPNLAANQFLRGTEDGLNTSGFVRKDGDFAFVSTLNLSTANYQSTALGGDAADGIAYFAGRQHLTQGDTTTEVDYYAGILSGTDLGNPLPRQYSESGEDLEVNWNGRIGWLIYDAEQADGYAFDGSDGSNGVADFELTINLTARTIRALIVRAGFLSDTYGFLLEGTYGKDGVIANGVARYGLTSQGSVSEALYTGSLIGLIGEQGAVGAFHLRGSGPEAAQGASGGFVVSSRESAGSDVVDPSPGSFNYWIANRKGVDDAQIDVLGRAEEINVNNPATNFIAAGGATGQLDVGTSRDFGTVRFSDQSPDGLGYGFANYGTTSSKNERFYVGLLASTDLGSPRTEITGSVTWNGRLAIAKQDPQGTSKQSYLTSVDNFRLKITFTGEGGMVETLTGADGIIFTRSIFDTSGAGLSDRFVIAGKFDRNGLLRGTTTYVAFNNGILTSLDGILTGLIGVEGVAGVFTSKASDPNLATVGHYVGGFVASSALDTGGADTWQANALRPDGATKLTVKNARSAVLADDDYTFIASGGNDTLDLGGGARKSETLTKDLTFDENLTLRNGDVFSLNGGDIDGGISIAQASLGSANVQKLYAGLLGNTFVGAPLESQPSVNWRGVLSIIAGTTPALHTTDFTLSVDFDTMAIYSNTVFQRVAGNLDHNIILQGRFNARGVIYGTATYQTGDESNAGVLTGLIGVSSVAAVFGGDSTSDLGQFIGGLVAVPDGTSETTPNSHFVWVEGIDETAFRGTQFNTDVPQVSTTQQPVVLVDTTYLGGVGNGDGSNDGFAFFRGADSIQHVGVFAGTHLGGPVTAADASANWHARMVGLIINDGATTDFNANFTLRVNFDDRAIRIDDDKLPTFVDAGTTYSFNLGGAIVWDEITGLFTGGINLVTSEGTKGGILRGIIGEQGAVGTFRVSPESGETGRTFVGGFVAVPESIGAARGQTSYWAEYAIRETTDAEKVTTPGVDTVGLDVKGVRGAETGDGIYTVIEGGLETLELGVAVDKNADPDLSYDLTFANTEVSPDGSTFNIDSTVAGGVSFSALETRAGKYYAGLLSGTDVGRLLTRTTPTANWVGRFGIIYGTANFDNTLSPKDFELAIDFDARTLKSHNPDDTLDLTNADAITFFETPAFSYEIIIDGEYNDRGIIYGTTIFHVVNGVTISVVNPGILTGLIGEKGAAAVFYSTGGAIRYVGGFVAVPNRGVELTNVYNNTPTSYNVWTFDVDTTPQKDTSSGADAKSTANTTAFTTEIPEVPADTNQIALNLALLGGEAEDGFIGYADDNARQIGLLSSIDLGGVSLETGTATWSVVMQWILGDGSEDIFMQSFELDVNFDTRTLTFGDIAFSTTGGTAYGINFVLSPWNPKSGLITGTISIATTATTPEQTSAGDVRGLIGREGVVVAFRSDDTAHTSFTGGFVAREVTNSETTFTEYFSSVAGGELLKDTANGAAAKFARTSGTKLLFNNGALFATGFYRLGAGALNTGSNPNGFVFAFGGDRAVGILNTTDLGAPLPLIYAGAALEWTGLLYVPSRVANMLFPITLKVNLAEGTIETEDDGVNTGTVGSSAFYGNSLTVKGYFGLHADAIAAKLPLGFLAGKVIYTEGYGNADGGTDSELDLIGQIGQTGVVGIFSGAVGANPVVGGFAAFSSGVTANAREFITRQGFDLADGVDQLPLSGNAFQYVNADGNIKDATNHRFGLGGKNNTPSVTNPNGFTIGAGGFGLSVGIWADADLGLLLPVTLNKVAIWTGTIQTLKYGPKSGGRRPFVETNAVESDFKIEVDFGGRTISTLDVNDAKGAVALSNGEAFRFLNVNFDTNGIIGCTSSCPIEYTINSITYGLSLAGVIGEKGALGVFRGAISKSNTGNGSIDITNVRDGPGIAGGFQVTPTARVRIVDPNPPRVVITTPKQLNYAAYIKYYQTDYIEGRHGPSVLATPHATNVSQFVQGLGDGTGLDTGVNELYHANIESFSPYAVYLNGEDAGTSNGFTLIGASFAANALSGYRNYAGLLAGADVGRFSDALLGTATWQGRFYSSAITVVPDFASRIPTRLPLTLTVNFDAGTIGTLGDVRLLNDHLVNIAGTFGFDKGDANQGILGGFITYTDPSALETQRITRAPIYGIIGDAGALGVFASGKYGAAGTGGDSPLVGGFEVSPNPVATVHYQIFVDYTSSLPDSGTDPHGLKLFNTVTQNSTLLKGTRTGLIQTGPGVFPACTDGPTQLCGTIITSQTIRLGENPRSPSGFVIMDLSTVGSPRRDTYFGLLSGTDLGAILPVRFGGGATKAIWHGSVYTNAELIERDDERGFVSLIHYPLSLTVDLSAGTLRTVNLLGNLGTVALSPTSSIRIDGRFGLNPVTASLPYGILRGSVQYNGNNLTLVGLIGVEGAIGIFRDPTYQGAGVTGGGFQVSPPPPPAYGRAEYAVFEEFYHRSKVSADIRYVAGREGITANKAQFVRGTQIGLVNHALTGNLDSGSFAPLAVYLGGDVHSGNGFVLENFNGTNVAGLLASTDLGFAPHAGLATATWEGTFYLSSNVYHVGADRSAPAPFEINAGVVVDFAAGTLTSSQAEYRLAGAGEGGEFISFGIFGEFGGVNELPLGILAGVVKYSSAASSELLAAAALRDLPVIGVIGREGALGVFRDPLNNNLVGGFQVGDGASYRVWRSTPLVSDFLEGILISPNRFGPSGTAILRTGLFEVNNTGTGLIAEIIEYDTDAPPVSNQQFPELKKGDVPDFNEVKYGLGDDAESLNGFILAATDVTTKKTKDTQTAGTVRVVGVGFLKTTNLGAVILDVRGSATWAGKAYVVDTIDDTTKVFTLKFGLNFANGTFNTIGGANGTITADGTGTQTLKIEGIFGRGASSQLAGYLASRKVIYNNGEGEVTTNSMFGLIGRGGAIGVFYGGGVAGAHGFAGGFWASPSTTATTANYANYLSHYRAEIVDSFAEEGSSARVAFFNGQKSGATDSPIFRLGGADDTLATNKNGIRFHIYDDIKTVGLLGEADLGVINPNTTASATWLGRLFVKSDVLAFNINTDQKQIGLRLDFAQGTITTAQPVEFRLGEQTHSVSILGSFGLHEFARDSGVRPTSGLLSGFVTYTHHRQDSVNVPLIGLIGVEGALGIFKANVAGLGVVGGFEVSPIPTNEVNAPNHATYARQFKGYVNGSFTDFLPSQISTADGVQLIRTASTHNPNGTNNSNIIEQSFRLGGATSGDTNYGDGFVFAKYIGTGDKSVGLLFTTDLGAVVSSNTATAIWSGRLVVHYARQAADTKNSQLDLRVNFTAGTIETLAPISIVGYKDRVGQTPSIRKQTLEVRGRFGSHLDALGLRTGILGGSIVYKVGHLTPAEAATIPRTGIFTNDEFTRNTITTAHLPLLGLIGVDGAIGVFHGSVSDVNIVGGFEVSPRAPITTTTASFARWARFASECGDIDTSETTTILLETECAIVEHTALAFVHPNDLFESDNNFDNTAPIRQGFVRGSAGGIDFSDALSPVSGDVITLTLGGDNFADAATFAISNTFFDSTGKRFSFGGDAIGTGDDGIAFIAEVGSGTTFYAGLLSGTDLGAPLGATFDGEVKASWPGRFAFKYFGTLYHTNDFVLDVNLTAKTISTAGVNARRKRVAGGYNGDFDWILQGRYDDSGIITGIIKDTDTAVTRIGTLTGLIGEQGAVGAFFIDERDSGGTHLNSFVGGFVAAPVGTISGTSYAHFDVYHTDPTQIPGKPAKTLHPNLLVGGEASLLAGSANGVSLNTAVATGTFSPAGTGRFQRIYYLDGGSNSDVGGVRMGGDEDGFVVLRGMLSGSSSDGIKYRAGILSGTDLGATFSDNLGPRVSADAAALWTGTAYIIHNYLTAASKDEPFATDPLIFRVDFTAGTFRTVSDKEGFVEVADVGVDHVFRVNGWFGKRTTHNVAPGILGGTVTYALAADGTDAATLELSGLIGADGAIGVFGESSGSLRFAGGFSARPFALTPAAANDNPPAAIVASVLPEYPTKGLTTRGGFVKLGNTLTSANVTSHLPTTFMLDVGPFTLRNDIDFTGGVGFFAATNDPNTISYHYAGVLADTNLGAHRTETAGTATWLGQFSDHGTVNSGDKNDFIDFHIDFGLGELQFRNAGGNGGDGTLTRDSNVYTLNGVFGNRIIDKNGTILTTGQLGGQITRTVGGVTRTAALSGLIGEKGVVGAFVNTTHLSRFAGGFWAVPELTGIPLDDDKTVVNFSDWERSFGRGFTLPSTNTKPPKGARRLQFLQGLATINRNNQLTDSRHRGLNEVNLRNSGETATDRFSLTLGIDNNAGAGGAQNAYHAQYGGEPLGGAGTIRDGVAGVFDSGASNFSYVGLLSGTSLGAPVNASYSGLWNGQFEALSRMGSGTHNTTDHTDFQLTVTFDAGGGGTLKTFVKEKVSASGYFVVDGRYDASGIISGSVTYGNGAVEAGVLVTSGTQHPGLLTGIIGQDGAIAGFLGGTGDIGNIVRLGGNVNFLGGFVARHFYEAPTDSLPAVVNYDDWAGATRRTPLASGVATPPSESQFLLSTGNALHTEQLTGTQTSVNLSTAQFGGTDLGGDITDGFAYLAINNIFLVGLSSTTNLGATLDATTALGTWNGSFVLVESNNGIATFTPHDFTLGVTFGGVTGKAGSVASGTIGATGYAFTGEFDSRGVIIGTTTHASNGGGVLQGLIGAEGAVGVFHSNPTGAPSGALPYGGGFVVKRKPPDPCIAANNCVNHALWLSNALDKDGTGTTLRDGIRSAGVATTADLLGHLITGETVLDTLAGESVDGITVAPKYTVTLSQLSGSTDINSGFGFAFARKGTAINSFYAGLLSGTNVGAPFTNANQPAAEWSGKILFNTSGSDFSNVPFTLDVGFTGTEGTIKTKQGGINFATNHDLTIDGRFGANGVIYGRVAYTGPPGFQNMIFIASGSLSGLIGVNGAVAVFGNFNGSGTGYGGGFVALPRPPTACEIAGNCVDYADWIANAVDKDEVSMTIPTVAGLPSVTDFYSFITASETALNLTDAANKNAVRLSDLTGNDNNTSGFAMGEIGSGVDLRRYVGILSGTNVGAPLTLDASINAEWTGLLAMQTENFSSAKAITLDVGFDGTTGTIKTKAGGFSSTVSGSAAPNIVIDGKFGANGVIYGTTSATNVNTTFARGAIAGTLTGLIGDAGAVGVFVGNAGGNSSYGYVGGFVVQP